MKEESFEEKLSRLEKFSENIPPDATEEDILKAFLEIREMTRKAVSDFESQYGPLPRRDKK